MKTVPVSNANLNNPLHNKHKYLLYYKQLKEISVISNLSLVISGVILADVYRNHRHRSVF